MPSNREIAQRNLARFEAWIAERDERDDWQSFLRDGLISRKDIVEACGFGRSALIQNPAIADLLRRTEERLARRRPATDERLARLEPYLEQRLHPDSGNRFPWPVRDGTVDLEAVAHEIGLPGAAWDLANDPACRTVLNAAAAAWGVSPINPRAALNATDAAVQAKLSRARTDASDLARALAEREATIQQLRRRNAALEEMLRIRDETGMVMRSEPIR